MDQQIYNQSQAQDEDGDHDTIKHLKTLKIISINVNSIISNSKRDELTTKIKQHNPDIVLISETTLNKKHKFTLKDYDIIRTDRPNATQGGGTAILIKNNIKYQIITHPSSSNNKFLEYTIINLPNLYNNNKKFYIISFYAFPNNKKSFIDELNDLCNNLKLHNQDHAYILAGDINAKRVDWGDSQDNTHGKQLRDWECSVAPKIRAKIISAEQPSFIPGQSYLDCCITDQNLLNLANNKIKTIDYDSDHRALIFSAQAHTDNPDYPATIFNYKATKWDKFTKKLSNEFQEAPSDTRNLSINEIEQHIAYFTNTLKKTIIQITPKVQKQDSVHKYLNAKIKKLQKNKTDLINSLHKLKITGATSKQIKYTKEVIKLVKDELNKEFSKAVTEYWTNQLKQIDFRKTDAFFPKINKHLRPKKSIEIATLEIERTSKLLVNNPINLSTTTMTNNNFIISDPIDKLNVIGEHYQLINSPRYLNSGTRLKDIVDAAAADIKMKTEQHRAHNTTLTVFDNNNRATFPKNTDNDQLQFCNTYTVAKLLKRLPNKTSSGPDEIPAIVLKHLPNNMISALTTIMNNSLNHHYFPSCWKEAKVLPVLKKNKNPCKPVSYRPISLTSNLSKIYEMVINNLLVRVCENKKIIPDEQFGFKRQHSTTHAAQKVITDILKGLHFNDYTAAVLIDLEKAFDSVWLAGLIFTLIKSEFDSWIILLVFSMIHEKKFRTWDGVNLSSKIFNIIEGLQQGTINSPLLFNIFTSKILKLFGLNTEFDKFCVAFADDLIVYLVGNNLPLLRDNLNETLNKINKFYQQWNLRMNPEKCESFLVRKRLSNYSSTHRHLIESFKLSTEHPDSKLMIDIPHNNEVKYLGIYLDHSMKLNSHAEHQLLKAQKALAANNKIFRSKHLQPKAKIICYQLLIRPILTYASPLW